ncbi:MAG: PAS domain S-box protein [Pseudomonadota bacterium]
MARTKSASPFITSLAHHAADPFRLLIESVVDYAIVMLDPAGHVASWNPGAQRIYGYTPEEIIGQHVSLFCTDDDVADGYPGQLLRQALAEGHVEVECLRVRHDGAQFWAVITLSDVKDFFGNHAGFAEVTRDITEQRRAEEAVRAERDLSTAVLNSLPGVYYMYDEEGRFLRWNRRLEIVTEYSAAEIARLHPLDLFEGPDKELLAERIATVFQDGFAEVEANFITKSGKHIPYYFNGSRQEVDGKICLLGMGIDISDYKRAEQALRESDLRLQQAQKLEAIGQLAGGVAHDFNNLLTVINGYTDVLLEDVPPDSRLQEGLYQIHKAGERAQTLTRQLLAFGRRQVMEPKILNLNFVIRDVEKIMRQLIGEDVILSLNLAPEISAVRADPSQVEQILINLVVNARDAMPAGGQLIVETQNAVLDESYCGAFSDLEPGHYVLLAVSDTGCGISSEIKPRIFEPFFTTKELGHGTGLGLATVHGIVKQSQGHVAVYSEPGRGTCFKIYLPVVADTAEI